MKGVFLDTYPIAQPDVSLSALHHLPIDWQFHARTLPAEIVSKAFDAEILITNKAPMTAQVLSQLPNLKCLLVAATGTNNVDLEQAQRQGICVCNVQNYGTDSVAQHTLMLMLCLVTQVFSYASAAKDARWQNSDCFSWVGPAAPQALAGKTLGIVGLGAIGKKVQALAKAFGMSVIVAQRNAKDTRAGRLPWDEFLDTSDIISLHCPLTPETKCLIDANALSKMKKTAFLINVARGPIIDEQALAQALLAKRIQGAGLDVLSCEPPQKDNPLLNARIENLIITPHVAWASTDARQQLVNKLANLTEAYLRGKPKNQVF